MTIREILNTTSHRPWALPEQAWTYYQEWNDALFLHWEVDADKLRRQIPANLELDLFNGKPWVSLVAFTMNNIRTRYLPSYGPISDFHEINIRTYVKSQNYSGVYFLSIEAGSKISCRLAKTLSGLPYRYSKIVRAKQLYQSNNLQFGDKLSLRYSVGNVVTGKIRLDSWLTERYALFQEAGASLNRFDIHHTEWPLFELHLEKAEILYLRFKDLVTNVPHRSHYSTGVDVLAWRARKAVPL